MAALPEKHKLLKETDGKRIIVAGGSSVAFGQYSKLIEHELPEYKVINYGLYGSLGSSIMLDLAQSYIRKDDIIIFSPEQDSQTLSNHFNANAMWKAIEGTPEILRDISFKRLAAMTAQFGYYVSEKYKLYKSGNHPRPKGVYRQDSFNIYGDIEIDDRHQNIMINGYDSNMPIRFSPQMLSDDFLNELNSFSRSCRKKGARILYRFPPMNSKAVVQNESENLTHFTTYLSERLDCEILGNPDHSLMDSHWFFDTNFHLNSSGTIVNTINLINDIKKILKDDSPVGIRYPSPPEAGKSRKINGDNSQEDCFLYKRVDDHYEITGLSDIGTGQKSLILPAQYRNLPVSTFTKQVFQNNETIETLIFQENISALSDQSFDGCTALKQLILKHSRPESCSVSQELLKGTKAIILVPAKSLSLYLTDYFWSIHSHRIKSLSTEIQTNEKIQEDRSESTSHPAIHYFANGGKSIKSGENELIIPSPTGHMRVNTAPGSTLFKRNGYIPINWNTKDDGSGLSIGFGSRMEKQRDYHLYIQWKKALSPDDLEYDIIDDEVRITAYHGKSKTYVIPEKIEGFPVRKIGTGAFEESDIDTVILPPSLFTVERGAFKKSQLKELYLFDNLYYIYDDSFEDCQNLMTLHINAATPPVYSGTYFDTFSDKFDWLLSISEQKKVVLFSGSATRFGYNSPAIKTAFPEYEVANMGVYAYTNALPQLMIIKSLMKEGDILLSSPEFESVDFQFCTSNTLDKNFWSMMESNYDTVARLDIRNYSRVFSSLCSYLTSRKHMAGQNYSRAPKHYDDEGNSYQFETYNKQGDFILKRPNGSEDKMLRNYRAEYRISHFPEKTINSLNHVYRQFLDKKINVLFTFSPRNRSSLTFESRPEKRKALQEYLEEKMIVPVISDMEKYLYSGIYFYLIDNHLSTEGVELRTAQIIEDLRKQGIETAPASSLSSRSPQ